MTPARPLIGERYHLFGIAGRGMAPLAVVARHLGATITGCDHAPRLETRDWLAECGVTYDHHHSVDHLAGGGTFVATGAARPEVAEVAAAQSAGTDWHRTDLLAHVMRTRPSAGVTGSHGKGTVAALTTACLARSGLDPLGIIGVSVPDFGGLARLGDGPIVAEVDDSDLTVARVATDVAVVTNLDEDQPNVPITLGQTLEAVGEFVARARSRVVLGPSPRARALESRATGEVWRYARDFSVRTVAVGDGETRLSLRGPDGSRVQAVVRLVGAETAVNASLAFVTALAMGAEPEAAAAGLGDVTSLHRRLEYLGIHDGVRIFDDYGGKHPVNVRAGIAALRSHFPRARVTAVFEPYLPHLSQWGRRYAAALGRADAVVIAPATWLPQWGPGRPFDERWWAACEVTTVHAPSRAAAAAEALSRSGPGDVVVCFAQVADGRELALAAMSGAEAHP